MGETNDNPQNPAGEQAAQFVDTPQAPAAQPAGPAKETDKDARMWAMFCHMAGVCAFLPILPVIGGIKVIPQSLEELYALIKEE